MVGVLVFDKFTAGLFQVLAHSLAEPSLPLAESWIVIDVHAKHLPNWIYKTEKERGTLISDIEGKVLSMLFVEEDVEEFIIG